MANEVEETTQVTCNKVMPFYKYHGAGNDFVVVDNMDRSFDTFLRDKASIQKICNRRFGVGSDGFIALHPHPKCAFEMGYYNSDGLGGALCGNGSRCAIAFAKYLGLFPGKEVCFETDDGRHDAIYESDDRIHVKLMDVTDITKYDDRNFFIYNGASHHVCFVEDLDDVDVKRLGREIRYSEKYESIKGANVNFIQEQSDASLRIRTYERGVEDETLACGSGAVASALACNYRSSLFTNASQCCHPAVTKLHALGGELTVSFDRVGPRLWQAVYLTGPACRVFSGQYYL